MLESSVDFCAAFACDAVVACVVLEGALGEAGACACEIVKDENRSAAVNILRMAYIACLSLIGCKGCAS